MQNDPRVNFVKQRGFRDTGAPECEGRFSVEKPKKEGR